MEELYLYYLRRFPIDKFKPELAKLISLQNRERFVQFTNSKGVTFNLDLQEYQMKQIFLYDIYERNTVRHLLKYMNKLPPKKVRFIDVGGNIGFFSMTVAKELKERDYEIHTFEPNPTTFELLNRNVMTNEFSKIRLNNFGLSNSEKKLELTFNTQNTGTASVFKKGNGEKVVIDLVRFDDYCQQNEIDSIDLLKVDIEGGELEFLQGAENILKQSPNILLIMEIVEDNCQRAGYSSVELFNYVKSFGFKAYLPKPWPFGLKPITDMPHKYHDNIIFLKGKS